MSGAALTIGTVQLKGVALGTMVGVLMSIVFHLLETMGPTNRPATRIVNQVEGGAHCHSAFSATDAS